jgi:hypothetical protein
MTYHLTLTLYLFNLFNGFYQCHSKEHHVTQSKSKVA